LDSHSRHIAHQKPQYYPHSNCSKLARISFISFQVVAVQVKYLSQRHRETYTEYIYVVRKRTI
jgi:hypothetical protein